jgi:Fe2+ or Zn2+ uptake regulation protein
MSFADLIAADIRLAVLQILAQDAGYAHNEMVLRAALRELGHAVSRDRMRTELHWLSEQLLVTLADAGGVVVARLTDRGEDVAGGRSVVPGVRRPGPEEC